MLVRSRVRELVFAVRVSCDWLVHGVHDRFVCLLLLVLVFVYPWAQALVIRGLYVRV